MLTGERPDHHPEVLARLQTWGHEDFVSYVVWACERALERGMLPHTNLGALPKRDLERLREVTASQGLMLESISERLMDTVHAGSPSKHPSVRLESIAAAGELASAAPILTELTDVQFNADSTLDLGAASDSAEELIRTWS